MTKEYVGTKRNRGVVAVNNVSCVFRAGEITSILGPSGCGKSTLLKLIANIIEPSVGDIAYGDQPISAARRQGKLGYVPQTASLLPHRTVRQNIELPIELGRRAQISIEKVLELVGLTSAADYYPYQLSVGMQQRTSLARALIYHPSTLLMDEPFSAIDELTRERLQTDLLRIHRSTGATIIFVTHSVDEAVFISDRVICMGTDGTILTEIPIDLPNERTMETRLEKNFPVLTYAIRSVLRG